MTVRSHHGCARCKRRRQKCDEAKPCSRCVGAGVVCEYTVILKWNGRVPRPAPQSSRRKKVKVFEPDAGASDGESPGTASTPTEAIADDVEWSPSQLQLMNPSTVLSHTSQLLLHHFVDKASFIAPHAYVRNQICREIIPMALESPPLLFATMALSGLHRMTTFRGVPQGFIPEAEIADLLLSSVQHLCRNLQSSKTSMPIPALLHTVRTLCVCEIYSGKADASWRVHVDGAKAMIGAALKRTDGENGKSSDLLTSSLPGSDNWLTSRWYLSVEALTALTARGLPKGQLEDLSSLGPRALLGHNNDSCKDYCLDLYTGYSSDLNQAFKEIGAAAWERQRFENSKTNSRFTRCLSPDHAAIADESNADAPKPCQVVPSAPVNDNSSAAILSEDDLQMEATWLEQSVLAMMQRDDMNGLKIPQVVILNTEEVRQFTVCNRAYQYSALIHIYRRIRGLNSASIEVQGCVEGVLKAVTSILPVAELTPWTLLTTPIFTAGCEALGSDRKVVIDLLQQLYETLRIRNISRAISILKTHWSSMEEAGDDNGRHFGDDSEILDFIPY